MAQARKLERDLYAELEALPDNMVGEIINGALYAHPRPARGHGSAATELATDVNASFGRGRGGPGGWKFIMEQELHLGPHVVVPDISGWKLERYPSHEQTPYTIVPPDWLCEILSPSTSKLDRLQKLKIYAEFGVPHCWYVDPTAQSLEVFVLSGTSYLVGPTFTGADPVAAPPFETHTIDLSLLWEAPAQKTEQG